ncbi:agmatinase [Ensifer aridi]|uniref:agmatinase n=1 Tax=Ensifer aridi TaxID=1708715 RepID=UPI000A108324|nr:agmatinase [Ensifer aridi]
MSEITKAFAPLDVNKTPRFAEVATFMRTRSIPMDQAGDVDVGIVGVPFDLGTNYRPGSRFGPAAIREASRILRLVNGHTRVAPFEIARIADLGDTPVHPVQFDESIQIITECFRSVSEKSIRPLALGGDHTISLPILRGLERNGAVGMIHFDAHTDTHDNARGSKINHGTPFRRAVEEGLLDPMRVVQIGLRSTISAQDEYDWARGVGMTLITMDDYESMGRTAVIEEARRVVGNGQTYLSFDIDGLDAIYCPGTGVPEPGGFSMRDALVMLRGLRGLNLIGADICEVAPYLDSAGITSMHAANLGFELLCLLAEASRDYAI